MKNLIPALVFSVAGFLAGIAFVVSCGKGPTSSSAQLNCSQYEMRYWDPTFPDSTTPVAAPAGWQPMFIDGNGNFRLVRCAQ